MNGEVIVRSCTKEFQLPSPFTEGGHVLEISTPTFARFAGGIQTIPHSGNLISKFRQLIDNFSTDHLVRVRSGGRGLKFGLVEQISDGSKSAVAASLGAAVASAASAPDPSLPPCVVLVLESPRPAAAL